MKYLLASLGGEPVKRELTFHTKSIENQKSFENVKELYEKESFEYIQTIWFNPWEYENHNEPLVGLLQEILNHFSLLAKTHKESQKLLTVAFESSLNMIGSFLKLGKNQGSNIKELGEKYESENFTYLDRNQKFKFAFQEAIETLLLKGESRSEPDESARLVIFIDDLDRCEDETISKLLKDIKQYLSTKRCVFIFGYDRHHIEKSLSSSETKTNKETRAYLEKLFQSTFYIKEPKENYLKEFIKNILNQLDFVKNSFIDELVIFIISILDSNPRRIKSFLTTLYFHIKNSDFEESKNIELDDLKRLALIAYLKLFYESVYSVIENQPELKESLINSLNKSSIFDVIDEREYYFTLEFKNHLGFNAENYDDVLNDDIESEEKKESFIDKIEYKDEFEDKFLSEVYEMQGKHRSFSNFKNEFINLFTDTEIKSYL